MRGPAELYRNSLPPGELDCFRVDGLDRLGVPVTFACHRAGDGSQFDAFGYGATPEQAEIGALGEVTENARAQAGLADAPRVLGSYRELVKAHGDRAVCDPASLCLPAGSSYSPDTSLAWVAAKRWPGGEPVLVPLEFALCYRCQLGSYQPLTTPITNGLGAGDSLERALAHGILELLQRDGNCTRFRALDQGRVISLDGVTDPDTLALLAKLDREGVEVLPKLATTEFGLTNLYVVGHDRSDTAPQPIMLTAGGEACDPDPAKALSKALLEFCAARSRKAMSHGPLSEVARVAPPGYLDAYRSRHDLSNEEPRALEAMLAWAGMGAGELRALLADSVFSRREVVPFTALPRNAVGDSPAERLAFLAGRLASAGLDILYLDLSPPGGEVFAVKAIVPGLECETLSYHRVGERGITRLLAEGSPLAGLGVPPPGAKRAVLSPEAEERLGGPAWLDVSAIDRLTARLYPLYREPESHAVRFAMERRRAAE